MAFWNRKTETKDLLVIEEGVTVPLPNGLGEFLKVGIAGATSSPAAAFRAYNETTAVSIPVNAAAQPLSYLKPVLKFRDGTIERDAPVLSLLSRPSPRFTLQQLLEDAAISLQVTGDWFAIAVGNINSEPSEIVPAAPVDVNNTTTTSNIVTQWRVDNNFFGGDFNLIPDGSFRYASSDELRQIQHIRSFSTKNNNSVRGQSPLVSASSEVRQAILGGIHNVTLLERGGKMSLSFHFSGDMSPDEFKANKKRLEDNWGGAARAGGVHMTAGGVLQVEDLGSNNRDMDYLNAMKLVQQTCAQLFHIPLPIVSTDAQTFNNYGTAILSLWDDAITPLSGRIFSGLSELLLPRFGMDPAEVQISFDPDDIQPLRERRDAELDKRTARNQETTDELRAAQGLGPYEPSEAPGGKIMVNGSLVPLGEDVFGDVTADIPFGAPDAPDDDDDTGDGDNPFDGDDNSDDEEPDAQ